MIAQRRARGKGREASCCKRCGKAATWTVRLLGVCMVCLKGMADLRQAVTR